MKRNILVIALVAAVAFVSCSKDDNNTPSGTTTLSVTDSINVNFSAASNYSFYRLSDSTAVPVADSATSKWDFAVRFTSLIFNSASSGPGQGGVIVKDATTFDAVTSAPTTGYAYDTTSAKLAINPNTWYNYDPTTHAFSPKAGRVLIIKTADGSHYAKLELLNVNYGAFAGPTPTTLIYKFRYTYKADGSTTF